MYVVRTFKARFTTSRMIHIILPPLKRRVSGSVFGRIKNASVYIGAAAILGVLAPARLGLRDAPSGLSRIACYGRRRTQNSFPGSRRAESNYLIRARENLVPTRNEHAHARWTLRSRLTDGDNDFDILLVSVQ